MQMMKSKLTFLKGCINKFEAGSEAVERIQKFQKKAEKDWYVIIYKNERLAHVCIESECLRISGCR